MLYAEAAKSVVLLSQLPSWPAVSGTTRDSEEGGGWTNIQLECNLVKGPFPVPLPPFLSSPLLLCPLLAPLSSLSPYLPLLTGRRGITHDLMKSHMLRCIYL